MKQVIADFHLCHDKLTTRTRAALARDGRSFGGNRMLYFQFKGNITWGSVDLFPRFFGGVVARGCYVTTMCLRQPIFTWGPIFVFFDQTVNVKSFIDVNHCCT